MIYWSKFSWEAFATIVAGLAAVAAAWWVGKRQLEIQRRQIKLIENDLKVQLLDKRTNCVSDMREVYHAWMQNAKLSREEMYKFHKLLEEAQLLFPPAVSKKLDDAVRATFWSEQYKRRAYDFSSEGEKAKADAKLEAHFAEEEKVIKLLPELLEDLVEHTRVDAWE